MRLDLLPLGIKVAEINPGAVETEFSQVRFKGDESAAAKVYEGFEPLRAEDVAEIIAFMVTRRRGSRLPKCWCWPGRRGRLRLLNGRNSIRKAGQHARVHDVASGKTQLLPPALRNPSAGSAAPLSSGIDILVGIAQHQRHGQVLE